MTRLRIQTREVPLEAIAKYMGVAAERFEAMLPRLYARGFPLPDPDTGLFDLDATDAWRRTRHAHLYGGRAEFTALDAGTVVQERIAAAMRGGR